MNPKVAITVMHTGSTSLKAMFEQQGYAVNKIDFPKRIFRKNPESVLRGKFANHYFYGHAFPQQIEVMNELADRGCAVVTCVRHPDEVAKSWAKRYELGYSRRRPITLMEQYELWLEWVVPWATVYRTEDLRHKHNVYHGVDYKGPLPDISGVRDRVMEVYNRVPPIVRENSQ